MNDRILELLLLELWAKDLAARDALMWAIENPGKSCWLVIGKDPMEGQTLDPPPVHTWRMN